MSQRVLIIEVLLYCIRHRFITVNADTVSLGTCAEVKWYSFEEVHQH